MHMMMNKITPSTVFFTGSCVFLLLSIANAFVVQSPKLTTFHSFVPKTQMQQQTSRVMTTTRPTTTNPIILQMSDSNSDGVVDDEIARLRSMAAKLRAEAASLEAEQAQEVAAAAEKIFRKFDTNQDGEISIDELKSGLEKSLKTELSDARVQELMKSLDASGDGALQLDEFVTIDQFKNKLEQLARDEKRAAVEAIQQAKKEEDAAALAQAKLEILNDKLPSTSDKILSILPYLFPLLDGLQYGRFLLQNEDGSNPFVAIVAILFTLYKNIPFSGFIAFFALNILSGFPSLNRLIRFNMQQAIFLDIALFFPGLLSGIYQLVLSGLGIPPVPGVTEFMTDAIFISLLLTLAYCSVSSLLGIAPDKIPLISDAVSNRMPTVDMFDDEGNFIPRQFGDGNDDDDEDQSKDGGK